MARKANVRRKTKETDITVQLDLDGSGQSDIDSQVGFLDHMLTHLARHWGIDLTIKARGDLEVDQHHTVEDIGICLGQALEQALGDKKGIERYGFASIPMDEALANVSVDLSGRPWLVYQACYPTEKIGLFDTQLIEEFLRAFCNHGKFNLHVVAPHGNNSHHIAEAIFKGLARALGAAVRITDAGGQIPSTKGTL